MQTPTTAVPVIGVQLAMRRADDVRPSALLPSGFAMGSSLVAQLCPKMGVIIRGSPDDVKSGDLQSTT